LRAGFDLAAEAGADVVVTLDADGQHDPAEMSRLVEPVIDGRADLVIGSRVLGAYEKDSHVRAAGVVVFNWMVSALTLRRITDCSNGFRAIRVPALARLDLRQRQFHTSELLLEAIKKGLRVIEVPVTIRTRAGGVSKKGPTLKYAIGFTRAILGTWLR
jgi:glycosyltransferase involved in cell wall biosynthesis